MSTSLSNLIENDNQIYGKLYKFSISTAKYNSR